MKLRFTKMNGAGNDFVVVDNRDLRFSLTRDQIARVCDRHRGVGADGFLAVEPPERGGDFRFRYYNSDGGEAEMCGNGSRCFALFARAFKPGATRLTLETIAGPVHAEFDGNLVRINLGDPAALELNRKIHLPDAEYQVHNCNMGVPHAVIFVENTDDTPVRKHGRLIRFHRDFAPQGTNVNFVQVLGPDSIRVRTYERGVEDETLACGTGVTASSIVAHLVRDVRTPVKVRVQGGDTLEVNFDVHNRTVTNVFLKGPAEVTFTGEIEV